MKISLKTQQTPIQKAKSRLKGMLPGILTMLAVAFILVGVQLPQILQVQAVEPEPSAAENVVYLDAPGDNADEDHLIRIHLTDGTESATVVVTGGTVAETLSRMHIYLDELDSLNCAPEDPVYAGMKIQITRRELVVEEEYVTIPYATEERKNPTVLVGQDTVLQTGVNGQKMNTYDVVYENGRESSRTLTASTVLSEPVEEVVEIGTYRLPVDDPVAQTLTFADGTVRKYTRRHNSLSTAYTCEHMINKNTATGTVVHSGTVAVDPRVIPLGSELYIMGEDGTWYYGLSVAEDTGGLIKGTRTDLYFDTMAECYWFEVRHSIVYVLEPSNVEDTTD